MRAARGRSRKEKSTQSRERGQGGTSSLFVCPLRSPEAAPLVGFGATPQLFLVKSIQREQPTKGAGSEASLPVTLRVLRRAPKLLYPSLAHCRVKWTRPRSWSFRHNRSFLQAGDFASAEATRGQWKRTKFAVVPLTPSPCTFSYLIFIVAGGIAPAGATKGLSDRPLETFGVRTFGVDFFRKN